MCWYFLLRFNPCCPSCWSEAAHQLVPCSVRSRSVRSPTDFGLHTHGILWIRLSSSQCSIPEARSYTFKWVVVEMSIRLFTHAGKKDQEGTFYQCSVQKRRSAALSWFGKNQPFKNLQSPETVRLGVAGSVGRKKKRISRRYFKGINQSCPGRALPLSRRGVELAVSCLGYSLPQHLELETDGIWLKLWAND